MKIYTWQNVDVECAVDIDISDVLNELSQELERCDSYKAKRRAAAVMDQLTRVLATISDDMIASTKPEHAAIIRDRLVTEAARWPADVPEMEQHG